MARFGNPISAFCDLRHGERLQFHDLNLGLIINNKLQYNHKQQY
jgi:hypothetical protein